MSLVNVYNCRLKLFSATSKSQTIRWRYTFLFYSMWKDKCSCRNLILILSKGFMLAVTLYYVILNPILIKDKYNTTISMAIEASVLVVSSLSTGSMRGVTANIL